MANVPAFLQALDENDPEFAAKVLEAMRFTYADGALDAKTKSLMLLLADAILGLGDGVASIAERVRREGATEAEIVETVRMAFMAGGLPGLVTALRAFPR